MPSGAERNGAKSNEGARGPLADLYASFVSARKAPFSDDLVEGSLERCLAALPPLCRRARITRMYGEMGTIYDWMEGYFRRWGELAGAAA